MRVSLAALSISLVLGEVEDDLFGDLNFDELLKEDFISEDWSAGSDKNRKQAGEANARRDFEEFDANKDHQLDPLEVRARFKSYLNEQDLYYFYDNADKDRSGTVSLEEYLAYVNLSHEQYKTSGEKKL